MNPLNLVNLIIACILTGYLFALIHKKDFYINKYTPLYIAFDVGQMASFVIGIQLYFLFPLKFSVSVSINIWIGAFIGALFCFRNESKLLSSGFLYGGIAVVMGTMVGASVINPAICGLPLTKLPIQNPDLFIGILSITLLFVTVFLVKYSLENEL